MSRKQKTQDTSNLPKIGKLVTVAQLDGRLQAVKDYRLFVDALVDQLGGVEAVSLVKKAMVERFAMLTIQLSAMDARALTGEPVDMAAYATISGAAGRIANLIGLNRVDLAKDISLQSILDEINQAKGSDK